MKKKKTKSHSIVVYIYFIKFKRNKIEYKIHILHKANNLINLSSLLKECTLRAYVSVANAHLRVNILSNKKVKIKNKQKKAKKKMK